MVLLNPQSLNFRVNLRFEGGQTLFLLVRTHAEQGIYGVDPSVLEMVEDSGFRVPSILAQMRAFLVEQEAWNQEGIFRLAGESAEINSLKQQINKTKKFDEDSSIDVNSIANLLKIWYRDLPTPILNSLPPEVICNSGEMNTCTEAYYSLKEPQRSLLGWLLSLMADVCTKKHINKMTEQNLAIVVAPNLYDPPGSDPMEGLVMSQKAVQFLQNLIIHEIEMRAQTAST